MAKWSGQIYFTPLGRWRWLLNSLHDGLWTLILDLFVFGRRVTDLWQVKKKSCYWAKWSGQIYFTPRGRWSWLGKFSLYHNNNSTTSWLNGVFRSVLHLGGGGGDRLFLFHDGFCYTRPSLNFRFCFSIGWKRICDRSKMRMVLTSISQVSTFVWRC